MSDKPYNAGDSKQVSERQALSKEKLEQLARGLKHIMGNKDGRAWMWNFLGECGIFRTSFTGNSTTFFNEGQRNIGLSVQADLTRNCQAEYLQMQSEAMK